MKVTRLKRLRKCLKFYEQNCKFTKPFKVLIDGTFCQEALKSKINIRDQLVNYLGDDHIKLMTTPCVIKEVESLGSVAFGATLVVKQYRVIKCDHAKGILPAAECIYANVRYKNPLQYFVATQDPGLTNLVKKITDIPLLYITYKTIILRKPCEDVSKEKIERNLKIPEYQEAALKKLKAEVFGEQSVPQKKKRKVKQPNPLSCKKKRKKPTTAKPTADSKNKRKRNRHKKHKIESSES